MSDEKDILEVARQLKKDNVILIAEEKDKIPQLEIKFKRQVRCPTCLRNIQPDQIVPYYQEGILLWIGIECKSGHRFKMTPSEPINKDIKTVLIDV